MIEILMATYNGEKFISHQIESILGQSFDNWQLLIRDDGSLDGTLDIIYGYINKYPEKIKIIKDSLKNLGPAKSFEQLLNHSTAEYVMFSDQDDIWLPQKIENSFNRLKNLEQSNTHDIPLMVFTDLIVTDKSLDTIKKSFWEYQSLDPSISKNWEILLSQNVVTGCTMLFNRTAVKLALPFPPFKIMHDHHIAVIVSKYGKVDFIRDATILYRQHGDNAEGARSFGMQYVVKKLFSIHHNFSFFTSSSKFYKNTSTSKLLISKISTNIKRLIKN